MKAINEKHQTTIDRFLLWKKRHLKIVTMKDNSGSSNQKRVFEKASSYWELLPKREQTNIIKNFPDTKDYYK